MNSNNLSPFGLEFSQEQILYAVVDCAHFDHVFYRNLRKEEELIYKSLFVNTPDESSIIAGPVLVQVDLDKNTDFISRLKSIEQDKPAVLWLSSTQNFSSLFLYLQKWLYAELETGEVVLCRYYDPRCLQGFLEIIRQSEKQLMDIVAQWAFYAGDDQYTFLS